MNKSHFSTLSRASQIRVAVLLGLTVAGVLMTMALMAATVWTDKQFTVDATGNISPPDAILHTGQRAVWTFMNPSPANAIVRQSMVPGLYAAAPYEAGYVNEFMTPLPRGMSGIFVISETGNGFSEQDAPCTLPYMARGTRMIDGTTQYLCQSEEIDLDPAPPNYQQTLDSTWANPAITGVFIRLKWSDLQTGPSTYDDSILLREVSKAVANGKLYSIAIKSGADGGATPTWLFDSAPAGAGLTPVTLDWNEDSASCAAEHDYGDPTDAGYRTLYLDMLSHVASVLKRDSAIWRSLAYVKLSGANSRSAENRLSNGCKAGVGCICNNEQWALAGYTPLKLYAFYEQQMARIAAEFPGKSMSYSLIQAGFPMVDGAGCYQNANKGTVCLSGAGTLEVGLFEQTQHIIDYARDNYGDDVAIAHLGLGRKPNFSDMGVYAAGCPVPQLVNAGGFPFGQYGVGSGCPNKWATDVGAVGGLTHFQTENYGAGVQSSADLESSLQNMWSNSNSAMLEIYEARAWEAGNSILDPMAAQPRTLAEWNHRLHKRREMNFPALGNPAPTKISFTFTRSIDPRENFFYFVPKSGPRAPGPPSPLLGYIALVD